MFCRFILVTLLCAVLASANLFSLDAHLSHQVAEARRRATAAGLTDAAATATLTLEGGWIGQLFDSVLPLIDLFGNGIPVPSASNTTFSFGSAELQNFAIGSINVFFQGTPALVLQLADVVYTAPSTSLSITSGSTTCSGTFTVSVSQANVNLAMNLVVDAKGRLTIPGITPSATFGSVVITPSFSGDCALSTAPVVAAITAAVESAIATGLPSKIGGIVLPLLSSELKKLKTTFVGQPGITPGGRLTLTVQLSPSSHSFDRALPKAALAAIPERDVAISLDAVSVDVLLAGLVAEKKLQFNTTIAASKVNTSVLQAIDPRAYNKCPQCPFNIAFYATEGPTSSFHDGAIALTLNNAVFGINAVNPANLSDTTVDQLLDFYINATIVLSNIYINHYDSKLYFMLAIPEFTLGMKHTSLGPINTGSLTALLDTAIRKYVVPIFNMDFEGIAVNLKPSSKLTLANVTFAAQQDVLTIATDLTLKLL